MILYRPTGSAELKLIAASGYNVFPPRLPEQPIFYPVLTFEYAEQIARDWNAKTPPYVGFVTRFEVETDYVQKYSIHTVGSKMHQELWIPSGDLGEFNRHIIGKIEAIATYYGDRYEE